MKTDVMMTQGSVKAIRGKLTSKGVVVSRTADFPLPPGAVINGLITDVEAVIEVLVKLRGYNSGWCKDVSVVIDSNLIYNRIVKAPNVADKKLKEIAKNEYRYMEDNFDNMAFDYRVLANGGEKTILSCAAEKVFLESYIKTFAAAKIKIRDIDISLSSIINVAGYVPEAASKTFVIAVTADEVVTLALFVNGVLSFSNRLPLVGERESEAFTSGMLQKLSSVIQFNKVQQNPEPVTAVYFSGLSQTELESMGSVGRILEVETGPVPSFVQEYPAEAGFSRDVYLCGALIKKG